MLFKDKAQSKYGVSRDVMMIAAALTTSIVGVGAASAQEGSAEEVVVTGSRAARAGYVAPTPTSVIKADVIERQAATGVGQVLVQNPAFRATRTPGANANNLSSPGQFTADLRGLGGQRTLVLVDDARVVPYAAASNNGSPNAVDLNLLPTMMIERVETVTGGASAQYGSDAVAGVVNIFMKKEYDGFRVRAQTGQSDLGDNKGYKVGFVGGTNLFEDKGHFVVGGEWEKSDGVRSFSSRDWGRKNWMQVTNGQRTTPNTAGFGLPALLVGDNVVEALGAGGRILSGPLAGRAFNPDGTTHVYQAGISSGAGATLQLGGEGGSILQGSSMIPNLERYSVMARYGYDFTNTTKGYIQVGYAESKSTLYAAQLRRTTDTYRNDNPFLPAAVATAYAATPTFTMSRLYNDNGNGRFDIENKSPRVTIGMEGAIGTSGWDWDAHYSWGRNDYVQASSNNAVLANYLFAIDAARDTATGNIVCRATLPSTAPNANPPGGTAYTAAQRAAAAGCVPLNPFGEGRSSAAAIAYVNQTGWLGADYVQHDAAINLKGEPFSTWAGKVSVATGFEYREETEVVTASSIAGANGFANAGNGAPWSGGFHVAEGYVETIVPLARDVPFAKLLDLNAAYRYADYSLAGGQTAWKAGLVWEPIDWLRFRATQSRDVRAPAPNELFSPGTPVTNTATVNGVTQTIFQNLTLGNPNLNPEKADTRTIGFVVKPDEGLLAGLRMSVDYYQIKLKGAITNLVTGDVSTGCSAGNPFFCQFFSSLPLTTSTRLVVPAVNLGSRRTSGLDFSVDYEKAFDNFKLTTSFSGGNTIESIVDTGLGGANGRVNRAGENAQDRQGAVPSFRGNLSETLTVGPASVTGQVTYVSGGKLAVENNTTATNTINDNSVPAIAYLNMYGSYDITQKARLFAAINNVLDRDPPRSPFVTLSAPINGIYYDKIGRAYQLGIDLKF